MAFSSCPSCCHSVKSTLQTCRHNCLDSSADRARSWLSSSTFHARAKFPFLVFVGDTKSLPSSKGSCLPDIPDCLPHLLHRHANPLSHIVSCNTGSEHPEDKTVKGEIFQCIYEVISCTVMNVKNSQQG